MATSIIRQASSSFCRATTTSVRIRSGWSRTMMSASDDSFEVAQFLCLSDNYGYLIHDPKTGETAAVDTPCADSYKRELERRGWTLTHILNTHHHHDHVGGNMALKTEGVKVYGPAAESIPGMDVALKERDIVSFAGTKAVVMDVGGHTRGHIAYYFPKEKTAFVGDSLFALGCGRMFEGTPKQFWTSLQGLRNLPDDTTIYCAHEYTEANARFAMSVEPGNPDLVKRVEEIKVKRARGEPTVPSSLGEEKATNPFLRGDVSSEIRKNVGASEGDDGATIFHKIRLGKDHFRG
ncbi:hypothetical protein ACHAW5_005339 [Stephanodiscus triporus]|uniref:hydroxyacylglutathione hydrolase n=1 Tax=Stephanodiscus triporus TaxID=2934178 RepID=A0ABD3NJN6_9STRA